MKRLTAMVGLVLFAASASAANISVTGAWIRYPSAGVPAERAGNAPTTAAGNRPIQQAVNLNEYNIPGQDAGIQLYLREKVLQQQTSNNDNVVLFLEPFGVPAAMAFDVPGYSWLEEMARAGYDAWALDVRGFGRSARPAAMEKPPLENPPAVRAAEGIKDLEAAVAFITKQRKVETINIVGWSWGTVLAGMYAVQHPAKVNRLVLYGAMYGFNLPSMTQSLEEKPGVLKAKLPAYQLAAWDMTMHHWHMMMNGRPLATPAAIEAVRQVFLESDPTSGSRQPNSIRRPMGPLVDLYYIWSSRPIYDAAGIKAPVLLIRGDADFFADPTFLAKLTGTAVKKELVIKEATHWVLYEKNRDQLLDATANFLKATNDHGGLPEEWLSCSMPLRAASSYSRPAQTGRPRRPLPPHW